MRRPGKGVGNVPVLAFLWEADWNPTVFWKDFLHGETQASHSHTEPSIEVKAMI